MTLICSAFCHFSIVVSLWLFNSFRASVNKHPNAVLWNIWQSWLRRSLSREPVALEMYGVSWTITSSFRTFYLQKGRHPFKESSGFLI
jgi:hypothetical protein